MTGIEEALYAEIDEINAAIDEIDRRRDKILDEKDDLQRSKNEHLVRLRAKVGELRRFQGVKVW